MVLDTVEKVKNSFWRLVGTTADDDALVENGEDVDEVLELYLTSGCRDAQRYMLDQGYMGWRKRSTALVFSGSDDADGGRYLTLPADFLRAFGTDQESCLREANGTRWGREIVARDDDQRGDAFYFVGDKLWLARGASPPTTLYLFYHYQHAVWDGTLVDGAIDFPLEARPLIPAFAADGAKEENWLPGGPELEAKIQQALARAQIRARSVARPSKTPRKFRKPVRYGNRW